MNSHSTYQAHKFGGTSLAKANRFIALKSLLTGCNKIIIVSATQGTTSILQTLLEMAKEGSAFIEKLTELENTHLDLAKTLLKNQDYEEINTTIKKDCGEIKDILHAAQLTHAFSKETQDLILGYGECWSAKILTKYLAADNKTLYLDAATVLFVHEKNGMINVDWQRSQKALDAFLKNKSFNQIIITGFIASTSTGQRTTLGRNGSDFSAAIFARLFKASCLTIWTDVDGIYTADPNRVRSAFVIESLSYSEALELAYFGAKVLHPMTIAPALEYKIPIYVKNSLNPAANGTCISATPKKSEHPVKGLTCIDHIALINIEGTGMIGVSGIAARVFQTLHQANISIILISQASSEHSICLGVSNQDADNAVLALQSHFQLELQTKQIEGIHADKDCAILAAVGDDMVGHIGVSGKLCDSLAKANINIRAISQGSSERNISVVIKNEDVNKALKTVHASFYLSRKTISIGLIGPGTIGSVLLQQIDAALDHLRKHYQVNLYVRGIMNSKKMLLSHQPIHLANWQEQLNQTETEASLDEFAKYILADDVPHTVIIDCTASAVVSKHYLKFLLNGIHVITPNKHANAGDITYYKKIKSLTQQKNSHYLYETTVCAGLPVITTLQDIIKTGDEIIKIEGVVSGTLSFIFNELAKGKLFSQIVLEAKQRGYTEPDPRDDLSGMDVARKLVCLAREIGHDTSLDDVKIHDLVPPELKSGSVEDFFARLAAYDESIADMHEKATSKNKRLCYVGTIEKDGTVKVAIESFKQDHPLARLHGTDNMLIFHTRRYHDQPLIIQGPGAGAEVTAAGVLADLLRLVSFIS